MHTMCPKINPDLYCGTENNTKHYIWTVFVVMQILCSGYFYDEV